MNKVLKGIITLSVLLLVGVSGVVGVKAATAEPISTTISLPNNSFLNGKERQYTYDYYEMDIKPTKLFAGPKSPLSVKLHTELVRPLYRLGIKYGSETKFTGDYNFFLASDINVTKRINMGKGNSGKRYLYFSTESSDKAGYGAINADVKIYNHS